MPRWAFGSLPFTAWQVRQRTNVPISEFLTGILPVAELDKHWTHDRIDIWGHYAQSIGDGVHIQAASLVAAEREVLVHKIEFWWDSANDMDASGQTVHLFTPLQTYDPCNTGRTIFFPWLQTGYKIGTAGKLARAFVQAGHGSGLQVVVVNGVPITSIGPTYTMPRLRFAGVSTVLVPRRPVVVWSFQDPPIRMKPFTQLCLQAVNVTAAGCLMNVNWYYSEREPEGDVG